MRDLLIGAVMLIAALGVIGTPIATAKIISDQTVAVTQVKIVTGADPAKGGAPTAWGVTADYIGPGDIGKLESIDIYLDDDGEMVAIKVVQTSYVGDRATTLFTRVKELAVQTLAPGANRPHKMVPITIRTTGDFRFP